jgi:hypothetical protein
MSGELQTTVSPSISTGTSARGLKAATSDT